MSEVTKLNFQRPQFRYLDALRRELTRKDRAKLEDELPSPNSALPKDAFPLTAAESAVAVHFFDELETYLKIEGDILAACRTQRGVLRKLNLAEEKAREGAHRMVTRAASAVAEQMLQSGLEGRLQLVVLFTDLQKKVPAFLWDLVNNQLMKSAMRRLEGKIRSAR